MRKLPVTFVLILQMMVFISEALCQDNPSIKFHNWVKANLVPASSGYCIRSFIGSSIWGQNHHSHIWDNALAVILSLAVGDVKNARRIADFLASPTVYDKKCYGYFQSVSIDRLPPAADDEGDWWTKIGHGSGANIALIQYGMASANRYYVDIALRRIHKYMTWVDAESIPEFPHIKPKLVREKNYIPYGDTPWHWGSRLYKSFEETMEFIISLHWASIATGEKRYDELAKRIFHALIKNYWDRSRDIFYCGAEYYPDKGTYTKDTTISFDVFETAYLSMSIWNELEDIFTDSTGMSKETWISNNLKTGLDGIIVKGSKLEGARFSTAGNRVIGTEPTGAILSLLWNISPDTAELWAQQFKALQFEDGSWWAGYDADTGKIAILTSGFGFSYDGKIAIASKLALALLKNNWYEVLETSDKKGRRRPIIRGEYRLNAGKYEGDDIEWHEADADREEWNWRYLYSSHTYNTFDPKIFNRLKVNCDMNLTSSLGIASGFVIDPWSFVGVTPQVTIKSTWGDTARVRLKYWLNTGTTIPEVIRTERGDVLYLPEIEVDDCKTVETYVEAAWRNQWGQRSIFHIGSLPVEKKFRLVRKLILSYTLDNLELTFSPLADQSLALSSDDPLELSNHHSWWEQSPWINSWQPGTFYSEKGVNAFGRGYWSSELSSFTRDSDYERLTFLRGSALEAQPLGTSIEMTIASPMGLWDEYNKANNYSGAIRLKRDKPDRWMVGGIYTHRVGFNGNRKDVINQVLGADTKLKVLSRTYLIGEVATSKTKTDLTSKWSKSYKGYAFTTRATIGEVKRDIVSFDLNFTHIDKDFSPALAYYKNTRSDSWWSRHISFSEPELFEGVKAFRLGDGIDIDRNVVGLTAKTSLFDKNKLDTFLNFRDVQRQSSDKHIETVIRSESTYRIMSERLTTKLLLLYRNLPTTQKGVDPLIGEVYDLVPLVKGKEYKNKLIEEGQDPSTFTFSGGFRYKLNRKWTIEGIYERTNDYSGFPQAILAYLATGKENVTIIDGIRFDDPLPTLSGDVIDKDVYPLPPYDYYNVIKGKINCKPTNSLKIMLSHTYNKDRFACGMDDNINHTGVGINYDFGNRLSFDMRYTYSKLIGLYREGDMIYTKYGSHYNVYAGCNYTLDMGKSLSVQYGVAWEHSPRVSRYSAVPWALPTLDTQHLIRVTFCGKW